MCPSAKNFSSESFEREFCPNKSLKQANLAQIEVRIVKASVSNSSGQGRGESDTGMLNVAAFAKQLYQKAVLAASRDVFAAVVNVLCLSLSHLDNCSGCVCKVVASTASGRQHECR